MGAKEDLIGEFLTDLPDGIRTFLDTQIPTLSETTAPTDVDSAILATGVLSHNLNKIFKAFEGMTLAAIPLYIGQLNTVNQGMLLAALEFVGGSGAIKVVSPLDGSSYVGHFGVRDGEWYACTVQRGEVSGIVCSVGEDEFELVEDPPGTWSAEWPTAIGQHTATFTATFADKTTASESVSFTVSSYATYPAEGDIVPEGSFTFSLDTGGDDQVQAVEVQLTHEETGETTTITLQETENRFEDLVDLVKYGPYIAAMNIALMVRQIDQQIRFVYGTDPMSA